MASKYSSKSGFVKDADQRKANTEAAQKALDAAKSGGKKETAKATDKDTSKGG